MESSPSATQWKGTREQTEGVANEMDSSRQLDNDNFSCDHRLDSVSTIFGSNSSLKSIPVVSTLRVDVGASLQQQLHYVLVSPPGSRLESISKVYHLVH